MDWLFKQSSDTPQLLTPQQRQAALDEATPEAMRYNDWRSGNSSWIAALRYNPIAGFAQMRTKYKGKVYTFGGMEFGLFLSWVHATSWGKFFNENLKGKFTQWADFRSVGEGIAANAARAAGVTVMSELGMR